VLWLVWGTRGRMATDMDMKVGVDTVGGVKAPQIFSGPLSLRTEGFLFECAKGCKATVLVKYLDRVKTDFTQ
jgi:hypothetical protein